MNAVRLQAGASLISLMVGLLVSMLSLLACLSMHKSLIQVTVEARSGAIHDGMVAGALMQLQRDLYNAGFGLEDAGADDVLVADDGALLWRSRVGAALICRGVREQGYTDQDSQTQSRELVLLEAASCSENGNLASFNWTTLEPLARFRNQSSAVFDFSVVNASCAPYGLGVQQDHLQVVVAAATSTQLANSGNAALEAPQYRYCLPNTYI